MDDPIFESCVELKVWRTRHASEAACLRSPGGYLETDETEIDGIQVSEVHCATANKFAARSVMRRGNSAGWVDMYVQGGARCGTWRTFQLQTTEPKRTVRTGFSGPHKECMGGHPLEGCSSNGQKLLQQGGSTGNEAEKRIWGHCLRDVARTLRSAP